MEKNNILQKYSFCVLQISYTGMQQHEGGVNDDRNAIFELYHLASVVLNNSRHNQGKESCAFICLSSCWGSGHDH